MIASLQLRRLGEDDFASYFAAKSDADDIRWSGHAAPPNRHSLQEWLKRESAKPNVMILGAFQSPREMAGYSILRLSENTPTDIEISYGVAARYRGRGVGRAILRLAAAKARERWPEAQFAVCWVAEDHAASIKAVMAAGFAPTDQTKPARFALPAPHEKTMRRYALALTTHSDHHPRTDTDR